MKPLVRALKVDLRRSVCTGTFLLSIAAVIAWLLLGSLRYILDDTLRRWYTVEIVLSFATIDAFGFATLILAISAISYSWSYCQDKDSGFLEENVRRVGLRPYSVSKVFATALSAFLAAVIALGLFTGFLYTQFRGGMGTENMNIGFPYLSTAAAGKSGLFYLYRFTVTGLTCTVGAVFGLMTTAFLPNAYLAFLSPLIAYEFYNILMRIFRIRVQWLNFGGMMFGQLGNSDASSFFIAVAGLAFLIVLFGFLFCRKLRKEQRG